MSSGNVYVWEPDGNHPSGGRVVLSQVSLPRLDSLGEGLGRLWGTHVRVRNGGELNEADPVTGAVIPRLIGDARPDSSGDFLFQPERGGGRMDKLPLTRPHYRARYVEAAHFGAVNTYYHVDRIAAHVDELLRELGSPPLPRVVAVVNAHHAAVARPDGTRDGILRYERWVPFQGGHYRLPSSTYSIAEPSAIAQDGEIHLGPGWKLLEHGALVDVAGARYRHNAAHNAGTIYHEYGHHVSRHTADFRANFLRAPDRQSNLKTELDEGFSDYWTATMLDSPHIWAWHRRHDDEEIHDRSLTSPVTMADYDRREDADPHANGTIWAVALWDLRTRMKAARTDGGRACDKLVLQTLLFLGQEMGDRTPARIESVRRARGSFASALSALLRSDALLLGGQFRSTILQCFGSRGVLLDRSTAENSADLIQQDGASSPGATTRAVPRASQRVQLHSGWAESEQALADLAAARERLLQHVPAEDVPETRDLFARGELGEALRRLDEPPLSVLASGDTMLGGRSRSLIAERGLEYPFKALRPLLKRSSIVLGNLEGPIAIEARKQPRNFSYRVEPRMGIALKRAPFHVMTLANNHLTDCGRRGVLETIEVLTRAGIATIGAGADERAAHEPAILQAEGLRIGFLGYYWNRRTAARGSVPGSAMDPPEALAADIGRLATQVDRVVVTFHWGVPYVREPAEEERARARFAIDCGADAVIGHHVHVIQPFEIHRGRPIFYGVGNCAFGSGNSKGEGLLVGLRFEPDRTRCYVYPIYVKNRDPRVDFQPKVLRGGGARHVLQRLAEMSGADGERLRIEDFRSTLDLPWVRRDWHLEHENARSS